MNAVKAKVQRLTECESSDLPISFFEGVGVVTERLRDLERDSKRADAAAWSACGRVSDAEAELLEVDKDIAALTAKLSALHKRREEIAAVLVSAGNRVSATRYAQSAKQSLFIMCRSLQDMLNLRVRRAAAEKERTDKEKRGWGGQ